MTEASEKNMDWKRETGKKTGRGLGIFLLVLLMGTGAMYQSGAEETQKEIAVLEETHQEFMEYTEEMPQEPRPIQETEDEPEETESETQSEAQTQYESEAESEDSAQTEQESGGEQSEAGKRGIHRNRTIDTGGDTKRDR